MHACLHSAFRRVYRVASYTYSGSERGRRRMSSVQSQIQQDWNNREFVETIASSVKRIAEFLNAFDLSARSRLGKEEVLVCINIGII